MFLLRPSSMIGALFSVRGLVFFVAVLLLHAGCAQQEPQISIESQSAVLSDLFLGVGSVFMSIRNAGGRDALLTAEADVPGTVAELHDTDGKRMVRLDRLVIPARDAVEMRPGGMHIMVFNLPKSVQPGAEIGMRLTFERSGERQIKVRFGTTGGLQGRSGS